MARQFAEPGGARPDVMIARSGGRKNIKTPVIGRSAAEASKTRAPAQGRRGQIEIVGDLAP